MAKVQLNAITSHFRGKIGDIVFKWYGDKLVVTRVPRFKKKKKLSPGEKHRRSNFTKANAYAQMVLEDPARREDYAAWAKKRRRSIQITAISDFMTSPEVGKIDIEKYSGGVGDQIEIWDPIPHKVAGVQVELRTSAGKLIESGGAELGKRSCWSYVATKKVASGTDLDLTVTAVDRLGKEVTREQSFRVP
jgi:hypothetical protein